jgi:hypothetical protein
MGLSSYGSMSELRPVRRHSYICTYFLLADQRCGPPTPRKKKQKNKWRNQKKDKGHRRKSRSSYSANSSSLGLPYMSHGANVHHALYLPTHNHRMMRKMNHGASGNLRRLAGSATSWQPRINGAMVYC